MSSTTSTASSNNSNNKSNTIPTATANGSEFSQEQWLDLLRVLPSSSRMNLQLALRQFLQETEGDIEAGKLDQKTPLPDASTLVRAPLPLDDMPQNTYGTDRYLTLLRQSLELDRKPLIPSATLDTPNGLDTLAAAALANTSAEVSRTVTEFILKDWVWSSAIRLYFLVISWMLGPEVHLSLYECLLGGVKKSV